MATSKKLKGRATSMPVGVVYGVTTAIVITMLLIAILVSVVLANKVDSEQLGYFIMGILLLSSFVGAMVSCLKIKRRWILVATIVGAIFYLVLLLTTAIVFGGKFQGMGTTGLIVMLGSFLSGFVGLKIQTGHGRRVKKYSPS